MDQQRMLTCVVIEDEPLAQQAFLQSLGRLASLRVVAVFSNAIDAFDQLPRLNPDVLFVDVNLPQLSGLDFLRACPEPRPCVVLVTAHPGYALEGFEVGALDYLLKPVSMDRLLRPLAGFGSESDPKRLPTYQQRMNQRLLLST